MDYYETKEGFEAEWRQTLGPADGCGAMIVINDNEPSGLISSPDPEGVGLYNNLLNCLWQLQAATNQVIVLNFTDINLEPGFSNNNYVY